jgi:tetratricopeptide (TPR) repeat protein
MSKKDRRRKRRATQDLRTLAERELDKENWREAVKRAKNWLRSDPGESARELLQRALFGRARQLYQGKLLQQARNVLDELLRLGSPPADFQEEVARLGVLLGVGTGDRQAAELLHSDPYLLARLADQTLQHPESCRGACPAQIAREAAAVRGALEAIEQDNAEQAIGLLSSVSRDSPFADWKLFARGLIAYYARQTDRMLANWTRLDPDRPAAQVAQALMVLAGDRKAADVSSEIVDAVHRLDHALATSPMFTRLKRMRDAYKDSDWPTLLRDFRDLARQSGQADPETVARITDVLWRRFVAGKTEDQLEKLIQFAPRPAIDPNWNRARALLAEGTSSLDEIEEAWLDYIADVKDAVQFESEDRGVAVALVYHRLARQFAEAADEAECEGKSLFFAPADDDAQEHAAWLRERATEYFELSQQHATSLPDVCRDYADTLNKQDRPEQAARAYREMCRRFPDDFDGLLRASAFFIEQGEGDAAKSHLRRALSLRPRDSKARGMMWRASIGIARQAAICRQFTLARHELDEAADFCPEGSLAVMLDVHRAAVEYKAGNIQKAHEYLEVVLGRFDQPAAGLLLVVSQAFRYRVARPITGELNQRLSAEIRGPCTSQVAGMMARYLTSLTVTGQDYRGLKTHRELVFQYLRGSRRVTWHQEDLRDVCKLLYTTAGPKALLKRLTKQGRRLFPDDPYFHVFEGHLEMERGPFWANRKKARRSFTAALACSQAGQVKLEESLERQCTVFLTLLDMSSSRILPPPFGPARASQRADRTAPQGNMDDDAIEDEMLEMLRSYVPEELVSAAEDLARELGMDMKEVLLKIAADAAGTTHTSGAAPGSHGRDTGSHQRKESTVR